MKQGLEVIAPRQAHARGQAVADEADVVVWMEVEFEDIGFGLTGKGGKQNGDEADPSHVKMKNDRPQ